MIIKYKCPHCGNTDKTKAKEYDGALGYEAVICLACGWYSDINGLHPADDFSKSMGYNPNAELTCSCGSNRFKSKAVTIQLYGIPCTISQDGPQYDDSEADECMGWDFLEQSAVVCIDCEKEFNIAQRDDGGLFLLPLSCPKKPETRSKKGGK